MAKRIIIKELKLKLELLKEKENDLKKLLEKYFSSEEEFNDSVKQNKELLIELNEIKKDIKDIEWQLKTDKEKKNHLQDLKDLKEKFKDDH